MTIIAFKIDARPFDPDQITADIHRYTNSFGYAFAFTIMLQDCLQAALHGNLADVGLKAVTVQPLPSGFLAQAGVLNPQDGLTTIKNLLARLNLVGQCEIATMGLFQKTYQHHSGPDYGPFESHFAESKKWLEVLKESLRAMTPKPPPAP